MPTTTKPPSRTGPECRACEAERAGTLRAQVKNGLSLSGFTLSQARRVENIFSRMNITAYFTPMSKKRRKELGLTKGKKWLLTLCDHGAVHYNFKHNSVRAMVASAVSNDCFLADLEFDHVVFDQ